MNDAWSSSYCNGEHHSKEPGRLKWWEVRCVWDGDSCEPRFDSPPPVPPPPSPPAAAARGTCGSLTEGKQCQSGAATTTLTSNCDGGECADKAACEAACEALNLDGCCYWRNNKTPIICEFHHAVGDKVQGSPARHATTCTASTISPPSPPNDCTSIVGRKDLKDPANSAEAWYAAPDGIWCYELPASYGCEGFYTAKHSDGGVRLCLPDGSTGDGINGYCDGGELYFCSPPPTPRRRRHHRRRARQP